MYHDLKIKPMPDSLKYHIADFRKHNAVSLVHIRQFGQPENVRHGTVDSATYHVSIVLKNTATLHIEAFETNSVELGYTIYLLRDETFYGLGVNYYNHHKFNITEESLLSLTDLSGILRAVKQEVNPANMSDKFVELTGSGGDLRLPEDEYETLRTAHIIAFRALRENIYLVATEKHAEERIKYDANVQVQSLINEISVIDQKIRDLQALRLERNKTLTDLSKDLIAAKVEANTAASACAEKLYIPQFKGIKAPLTKKD